MKKSTFRQRFQYWFDGVMARGTGALLGILALATAIVILIDAAVILFLDVGPGGERQGFLQALWDNMIRTIGADDVAENSPWAFRVAVIVIAFVGVFVVANLIGIVSGAFDARVAQLRKGRSKVLESGHTVILGWNSKIPAILNGLCVANRSLRKPAIVILADRDKVQMEDEVRDRVPDPGRTRIICRSGNPLDQDDLLITSPFGAKSVIILSAEAGDDPDSRAVKTALALARHPGREGRPLHVVGQLQHSANLEVARLVGGADAAWILATEKVGQITAQTSRQPGLSAVYVELLSFSGAEIYFTDQPSLHGSTYFEAQLSFTSTAVIGVVADGRVVLNPPADRVYAAGEQLVVIAEDDSTVAPGPAGVPDTAAVAAPARRKARPERTLILGANSSLPHILRELDMYAAKGSIVSVVSEHKVEDLGSFRNLAVAVSKGSTTRRPALEALDPTSYDHVIVAAYRDHLPVQEADTKTLVTLLHLRDMTSRAKAHINVVSEMLDERNRKLAEVCQIDDFIVSDHLVSLMMSQVSENPALGDVFSQLFSSEGVEIYLRPAGWYVQPGVETDFYAVLAGARARGETAFGYLSAGPDGRPAEVVVKPVKTDRRTYGENDRIIVLAED